MKAEEALKTYNYSQDLQLGQINYTNVRTPYEDWPENLTKNMKYSQHFQQEVNLEESGVHIPIEIYEGCKYFMWTLLSMKPLCFICSFTFYQTLVFMVSYLPRNFIYNVLFF